MKNNLILAALFVFANIIVNNILLAEEFKLESLKLDILNNGNTIIAYDGNAILEEKNLKINATKLEYDKKKSILVANNGVAEFLLRNLTISANKLYYNEITSTLEATGNVKIQDSTKNVTILSENIVFDI